MLNLPLISANAMRGAAGSVVVPDPVFLDRFTGADGSYLINHTPDLVSGGATWQQFTGGILITDNKADPAFNGSAAGATAIVPAINCGYYDGVLTCDVYVNSLAPFTGVLFRGVDVNNFWAAGYDYAVSGGSLVIYEVTSGTVYNRASAVCAVAASPTSYSISVRLNGNSIQATVNGVTVSYTSSVRNTATFIGMDVSAQNTARFDNLTLRPLY